METDEDVRQNIMSMNALFDAIISDANILNEGIEEVDLTQTNDLEAIAAMMLGKLSLIESCCDSNAIATQKKYDARKLRDRIQIKKKQLAELEIENANLIESAKKQEKLIQQTHATAVDFMDDQQTILKLRLELQQAQNEIKVLEEKRKGLILDSKHQAHDISEFANQDPSDPNLLQALKEKEQELEAQRERERRAYLKRMAQFKAQREDLNKRKAQLEAEIAQKNDELSNIHASKQKKNRRK